MPDAILSSAYDEIGTTIQLSVAPVFLLVAIGSILNVVTTRLGRVVDRARNLETEVLDNLHPALRAAQLAELATLDRRMFFSNLSVNLFSASALLVAIVVAVLFIGEIAGGEAAALVAGLFILAMIGIICGLCAFLVEIAIATRSVRVRAELLSAR